MARLNDIVHFTAYSYSNPREQTNKETNKPTIKHTNIETNKQFNNQIYYPTNNQRHKQTKNRFEALTMTIIFFACCTWRVEKTRTFPLHIKDVQVLSGWF